MTICSGHGFSSSKPAIRNTCAERPGDLPAMRLQIGQEFGDHRALALAAETAAPRHAAPVATPCAARRSAARARAIGSAGISLACRRDRLDDAVHQPAEGRRAASRSHAEH